jgi:serine/threonine protein phosphatase PrpC
MSTRSLKSAMHRGIGLLVRSVFGGVLILTALLLLLPPIAFAFTPSVAKAADPAQNVAQAGVSVVRLVVTYTPTTPVGNGAQVPQCTGLGVLVSSWAARTSTEESTWVLTDGNLVNPAKMTCTNNPISVGGNVPNLQLTQIQVLASGGSGGYTNPLTTAFPIDTIPVKPGDVICENATSCSQGLALIGFSTAQAQPFIDLSPSTSTTESGIELTNPNSTVPVRVDTAQQYLTPHTAPVASSTDESGMPIVDAQGNLTGLHLMNPSSPVLLTTVTSFLNSNIPQNRLANTLHDNWDKGIQAYYQTHDYPTAQNAFRLAASANSQFQAAVAFESRAAAQIKPVNGGGVGKTGSGNTETTRASGGTNGLGFPLWQVSVAALVLLLVILLVISLLRARVLRQRGLEKFKEDEKAAERQAAIEAQRIAEMEARQGQAQAYEPESRNGRQVPPALGEAVSPPPVPIVNTMNAQAQPYAAQVPVQMSPVRDMFCPQCGRPVAANAQVCPNCNTRLSPLDSGLHIRAVQPQPGTNMGVSRPMQQQYQQPQVPQAPQVPPQQVAPAAPPAASPAPSYAQVGPQFAADQPTLQMSPGYPRNGQEDTEKTLPYNIQRVGSGNLGLAVGTRTDPGIKRKHKPNEDSLFAAQGAAMFNSSPQQFGLFVVADGMGGHANGQDASRLAIQTIIDYVLPRLSTGDGLDRNAFVQLLVEGVQRANQAVFQSNMEHRADMGTTMTTALVVGATAYVANVGDSRTYLYREPEGLTKITNDHSVVASLVEAGIIKPDDIYTHPKRNQIYRSLGEKPAVEVDSFVVDLRPGDKLLLCTDGLWDMVRDPGIREVLHKAAPNPDQTGEALIQAALQGGGEDNVSVIVVYVTESAEQTGITGIRVLARPETVQMPPM